MELTVTALFFMFKVLFGASLSEPREYKSNIWWIRCTYACIYLSICAAYVALRRPRAHSAMPYSRVVDFAVLTSNGNTWCHERRLALNDDYHLSSSLIFAGHPIFFSVARKVAREVGETKPNIQCIIMTDSSRSL